MIRCHPCLSPILSFLVFILGAIATDRVAQGQETETTAEARTPLREQSIYIPYDKLQQMFEREGRGVYLPYERFQELWKAARQARPDTEDPQPPLDALIISINSEAVVQEDVVQVTATIQIDALGTGWIEVPLQMSDVAVLSAKLDDTPARIISGDGGQTKLLFEKKEEEPKRIQLVVEYAKNYTKAPGQNSVSFDAPRAAVNRWRIRIPESGVKVNIHPLLVATEVPADGDETAEGDSEAGEDETVVLAFVGAAPSVRIDWTPKSEGAMGLDALVSVQVTQQIIVTEGVTRTKAQLAYAISRAELSQLTIRVPKDQKIVELRDPNVRQWNVEELDDVQEVTVSLFEPATGRQNITVELEKFTESTAKLEVAPPMIEAVGVGRQRGVLVVRIGEGLRADAVSRTGLVQLDTAEIPKPLAGQPWNFSYRYAALPFDLALRVEKVQPRISVDQLVDAYLQPELLTLDLYAKYNVERAGLFELTVVVPAGFEVRQVRGDTAAASENLATPVSVDSFTIDDDDNTKLRINLSQKAQGVVGLFVQLEKTLDDPNLLVPTGETSTINISVPRVNEEGLHQSKGRLVVSTPENLRVGVGSLTGLRSISFEEARQEMPTGRDQRWSQLRPVLAFAFAKGDVSAQVTAQRRSPRVTVQQLLTANVDPGVAKYEATFFYNIRYSGVKSVRIDIPAELVSSIRNESQQLREETIDPPPEDLAEGYVAWKLTGESELIGQPHIRLTWDQPISEFGIGKSVDLVVPRLIPRDVERADGQIVLVKAESIDLRPKGETVGLDPIDPQHDLMGGLSIPNAAAALEFHDDWQLTLTATRYQLEVLKNTSIERSLLRMVVTRSDRVAVQAIYRMRSNRQRLEIRLPQEVAPDQIEFDTDPLRINGRPVALEQGADKSTFLVPLMGMDSLQPFVLELRYTAAGTTSELRYPYFPDEPAVQQVYMAVYVPEERSYLGSRGPWTGEMDWRSTGLWKRQLIPRHDINELIGRITNGVELGGHSPQDFPVDGQPLLFSTLRPPEPDAGALQLSTAHDKSLHALIFALIAISGVTMLRQPSTKRLAAICAAVAAVVLLGVFLPTFSNGLLDGSLILAVLLVCLMWIGVAAVHTLPQLAKIGWPGIHRQSDATGAAPTSAESEVVDADGVDTKGGDDDAK